MAIGAAIWAPEAGETAVAEPDPGYDGDPGPRLAELEQAMVRAAQALEFEKAAALRDELQALRARLEPVQ